MSKTDQGQHRARYTLEFKLEAVRLVKAGQEASVTARVLGMPKQTLSNWVRLAEKGELQGAGERPVSAEQMELARLRAELARVKREREILKGRPSPNVMSRRYSGLLATAHEYRTRPIPAIDALRSCLTTLPDASRYASTKMPFVVCGGRPIAGTFDRLLPSILLCAPTLGRADLTSNSKKHLLLSYQPPSRQPRKMQPRWLLPPNPAAAQC